MARYNISEPAFVIFWTTSGTDATRCSPGACSFGTAMTTVMRLPLCVLFYCGTTVSLHEMVCDVSYALAL